MNTKVETKTITMSYENFEAAIVSFLYATRTIPESWDVTYTDFGIPLSDEGFVEFQIEIAKPVSKPKLSVVDKDFVEQDNKQTELPFETFERIHVKDR